MCIRDRISDDFVDLLVYFVRQHDRARKKRLCWHRKNGRRDGDQAARSGRDGVGTALLIMAATIKAGQSPFGGFVLIDKVNPIAGEKIKAPGKSITALIGASHIGANLMFEGSPFDKVSFAGGGAG